MGVATVLLKTLCAPSGPPGKLNARESIAGPACNRWVPAEYEAIRLSTRNRAPQFRQSFPLETASREAPGVLSKSGISRPLVSRLKRRTPRRWPSAAASAGFRPARIGDPSVQIQHDRTSGGPTSSAALGDEFHSGKECLIHPLAHVRRCEIAVEDTANPGHEVGPGSQPLTD